jgi:hypothetical protein
MKMKQHPFVAEMTGFDRFAHRVLTRLFNYRDIVKPENGKDTLYLRRFYIIRKGPFKLFLHNIRRSDSDRHLHDHPWDFDSICLKNGYIEFYGLGSDGNQATKVRMFSPFNLFRNKAEHTHIVQLPCDFFNIQYESTWTLVHTKKARRTWGFWVDGKHVEWRTYLGLPANTPDSEEDV